MLDRTRDFRECVLQQRQKNGVATPSHDLLKPIQEYSEFRRSCGFLVRAAPQTNTPFTLRAHVPYIPQFHAQLRAQYTKMKETREWLEEIKLRYTQQNKLFRPDQVLSDQEREQIDLNVKNTMQEFSQSLEQIKQLLGVIACAHCAWHCACADEQWMTS
jgi:hypothetical protein